MRKIIVEVETSIDGSIGGNNMEFWQKVFQHHTEDVNKYLMDLLFMPGALLMGRKTYEVFSMVWPSRQGKDAERINNMPKYVASRTLKEPLVWNSSLIKGDVIEEIRALKEKTGKDLLQYGVGELTHSMLKASLVDELRILIYPFTFGEGPHIFENMGINTFKLLETKTFNTGTVALHYQTKPK